MANREYKGKSIIAFPQDYVILDIETTGLDPTFDSIIEVSALKIKSHEIIESFSSLVKPDDFDENYEYNKGNTDYSYLGSFITSLTGITDEMIQDAPYIKDILPKLCDFINSSIIVGHNVNFDINFIYDNSLEIFNKPFVNDFIDTMRISRCLDPDMKHHRLSDLAKKYNISYEGAHRSEKDCNITKRCFDALFHDACDKYGNIDNFINAKTQHSKLKAKDIKSQNTDFDCDNPLYNKVVVFTGTLERMQRKEAMQHVVDLGGSVGDNVTEKTNYLVLADHVYNTKNGKSTKQKKAEALKIKGFDIDVIPENIFYEFLEY